MSNSDYMTPRELELRLTVKALKKARDQVQGETPELDLRIEELAYKAEGERIGRLCGRSS